MQVPVIKNLLVLKAKQLIYSRGESRDRGAKSLAVLETKAQAQVNEILQTIYEKNHIKSVTKSAMAGEFNDERFEQEYT